MPDHQAVMAHAEQGERILEGIVRETFTRPLPHISFDIVVDERRMTIAAAEN